MPLILFLFLLTTILTPSAAEAGPVIPFIGVIAGAVGATGVGAFLTTTFIGQTLVSIGLAFASSMIQKALAPKAQSSSPSDMMVNYAQATSYFERVYGRVRKGGPIAFTGFHDKSRRYAVIIASHRTQGPVQHYLDERQVDVDSEGRVTTGPIGDRGTIRTYRGLPGQSADPMLLEHFTEWTSAHDMESLSYATIRAKRVKGEDFSEVYPNSREWVYAPVWDGYDRVYDPRDGERRWTRNAALIIADWIVECLGADVDWDEVEVEADVSDELVLDRNGDLIPRWQIDGVLNESEDIETQRARLAIAADVFFFERPDGKVGFRVGRWIEPTVELNDDDFLALTLSEGSWGDQAPTEIVMQYVSPDADWREVPSAPYVIEAGDESRRSEQPAAMISNHNQALRVAKRLARIERAKYRLNGTLRLSGYQLMGERFFRVAHAELGISQVFEVDTLRRLEDGISFEVDAHSVSALDFVFSAATEEPAPPAYGEKAASDDTVEAPTGVEAVVLSGYSTPAIRVSWTDQDETLTQQVRYREVGASAWIVRNVTGEQSRLTITDLRDRELYEFQVANRTAALRPSTWAPETPVEIRAVRNSTAPAAVSWITATASGSDVEVRIRAANDSNHDAVRLHRADYPSGYTGVTAFADAVLLDTLYGAPGAIVDLEETLGAGVYVYFAEPINASGVPGPVSEDQVTV